MPKAKPCTEEGCPYLKKPGHPRWCVWHWLPRQPAAVQVDYATKRLREARRTPGFIDTPRIPEKDWPTGERWCSGCQSFVALHYARGSRCKGCASKAAHASHVKRTYGLDYDEYERLLAFQGGRCYVCGQVPRQQRLAVDHDHESGVVRGLLCANDEFGCNVSLRRLLGNVEAAKRLLAYVEKSPIERMRDGDPRPVYTDQNVRKPSGIMTSLQRSVDARRESARQEPPVSASLTNPAPPSHWTEDPSWAF